MQVLTNVLHVPGLRTNCSWQQQHSFLMKHCLEVREVWSQFVS